MPEVASLTSIASHVTAEFVRLGMPSDAPRYVRNGLRPAASATEVPDRPSRSEGGEYQAEGFFPGDRIADVMPGHWKPRPLPPQRLSKLVGILFCHAKSSPFAGEILGSLQYFHIRSGRFIDFFCAGYAAHFPPSHFAEKKPVAKVDGVRWFFSDTAYNALRSEVEANTKWKYNGETELILLSARSGENNYTARLDFNPSITCNLEAMKDAEAISSVRAFFESIIRLAEKHCNGRGPSGRDPNEQDHVSKLSDAFGAKEFKNFMEAAVLQLLPESLRKSYKSAKHFVIRDISKEKK